MLFMRSRFSICLGLALVAFAALASMAASAADNTAGATEAETETKYTAAIETRTQDILKVLALTDTNAIANVHDAIIAQYRGLNAWHAANDAALKAARGDAAATAEIRKSLTALHDAFLARLAESLTPEQIEKVKDKMTYGKVQFTFNGYVSQYPALSEENKQVILQMLKQAREEAMDGGSAAEKTAVFQRYKGKINNYLARQHLLPEKRKTGAPAPAPATNSIVKPPQ